MFILIPYRNASIFLWHSSNYFSSAIARSFHDIKHWYLMVFTNLPSSHHWGCDCAPSRLIWIMWLVSHSHALFIWAKSPEDTSQMVNDHYLFQMLQGARDKNFRAGRQRLKGEIVLVIVHLVDGREAWGMARYLKIGEWWRRRADRHFKQLKSQFNNH